MFSRCYVCPCCSSCSLTMQDAFLFFYFKLLNWKIKRLFQTLDNPVFLPMINIFCVFVCVSCLWGRGEWIAKVRGWEYVWHTYLAAWIMQGEEAFATSVENVKIIFSPANPLYKRKCQIDFLSTTSTSGVESIFKIYNQPVHKCLSNGIEKQII